jgi:hypothetical protein
MHGPKRNRFCGQRISQITSTPNGSALGVPTEDAFDPDDNVFQVRKYQLKKQFRIGFNVFVDFGFATLVDDTDVHFSCMQVDTAVIFMLPCVEPHLEPPLVIGNIVFAETYPWVNGIFRIWQSIGSMFMALSR